MFSVFSHSPFWKHWQTFDFCAFDVRANWTPMVSAHSMYEHIEWFSMRSMCEKHWKQCKRWTAGKRNWGKEQWRKRETDDKQPKKRNRTQRENEEHGFCHPNRHTARQIATDGNWADIDLCLFTLAIFKSSTVRSIQSRLHSNAAQFDFGSIRFSLARYGFNSNRLSSIRLSSIRPSSVLVQEVTSSGCILQDYPWRARAYSSRMDPDAQAPQMRTPSTHAGKIGTGNNGNRKTGNGETGIGKQEIRNNRIRKTRPARKVTGKIKRARRKSAYRGETVFHRSHFLVIVLLLFFLAPVSPRPVSGFFFNSPSRRVSFPMNFPRSFLRFPFSASLYFIFMFNAQVAHTRC